MDLRVDRSSSKLDDEKEDLTLPASSTTTLETVSCSSAGTASDPEIAISDIIDPTNRWFCRNCAIYGTYKSPHDHFCGGAYFGWLIGATPTNGRTCCNCVLSVTGSEAGYSLWSCRQCNVRKSGYAMKKYDISGFYTAVKRDGLNTPDGQKWLLEDNDSGQSGPEYLRRNKVFNFAEIQFKTLEMFLPAPIATYKQLLELNVENNEALESLPTRELCELPFFVRLLCKGCTSLVTPPPEIAMQGGEACVSFLRSINSEGIINKNMGLFLVGDGESGKTSLIRALKSQDFHTTPIDVDNRTVGIDISDWGLMKTHNIDFTVYDMAGQSLYRDTHTYFIGRRSLYVFIWKCKNLSNLQRSDTSKTKSFLVDMVSAWIDSLNFRIPGASIVIVATHADSVSESDAQIQIEMVQNYLIEYVQKLTKDGGKYASIRLYDNGRSHLIDSITGRGVAVLLDILATYAKSLPWYGELIPRSWIQLKDAIVSSRGAGKSFLSWDDYSKIALENNIKDPAILDSATKFLHETGYLRYFGSYQSNISRNWGTASKSKKLVTSPKRNSQEISAKTKSTGFFSALFTTKAQKDEKEDRKRKEEEVEKNRDHIVESILHSTVYVSPSWLCDVIKGVVRHDRKSLFNYFKRKNDKLMLRRLKKAMVHGLIHISLVKYMWPASDNCLEYWTDVKECEDEKNDMFMEKDLWQGAGGIFSNIVDTDEDCNRALSVLVGFDIIVIVKDGDHLLCPQLASKTGTHFKTHNALSSIPCPFISTYELKLGCPSGFFERITAKAARFCFHSDISSTTSCFYSKGNIASLTFQTKNASTSCSKLSIRSSSNQLCNVILSVLTNVSDQYPGMKLSGSLKTPLDSLATLSDPLQILIVASSESKIGGPIKSAIAKLDPELHIHVITKKTYKTLSRFSSPRLVLICVDNIMTKNSQFISAIKAIYAQGLSSFIPLLIDPFKVTNYNIWWPKELPFLEEFKIFIDFRGVDFSDSDDLRQKVVSNLYPQCIRSLNIWLTGLQRSRTKSISSEPDLVEQMGRSRTSSSVSIQESNAIVCCKCAIYFNDLRECGTFNRSECTRIFDEYQTSHLEEIASGNKVDNLAMQYPKSLCSNAIEPHMVDVSTILSETIVFSTIPCPNCNNHFEEIPHFWRREDLLCIFDDEDTQRHGVISCPMCLKKGRSDLIQILDILRLDVFISYNWGLNQCTQELIKPIVTHIELETGMLCWFDINGGLSAGDNCTEKMVKGVSDSCIVVIFLTDAYINSVNCRREFLAAVESKKYILPILMEGWSCSSECPESPVPVAADSGGADRVKKWWSHAQLVEQGRFKDAPDHSAYNVHGIDLFSCPWKALDAFKCIDLRPKDTMPQGIELLIQTILSRVHRCNVAT